MGKYDALAAHLRSHDTELEEVRLPWSSIEALVGGLPRSASGRTWWGNAEGNPHARCWMAAGWIVHAVDLNAAVTWRRGVAATRPRSAASERESRWILDGTAALERVLTTPVTYPSIVHAVAAHTVFLDPGTVEQAGPLALWPIVRVPGDGRTTDEGKTRYARRTFGILDGREVMFEDNTAARLAFIWSAGASEVGPDTQVNHVWQCTRDADSYTALWNLCVTPSFLAKLTDTHLPTKSAIAYRSYDLYGYTPAGTPLPDRPDGYDDLDWAASPPPLLDLAATITAKHASNPLSTPARAAARLGWRFGDAVTSEE